MYNKLNRYIHNPMSKQILAKTICDQIQKAFEKHFPQVQRGTRPFVV